jgi:hypothetical protein
MVDIRGRPLLGWSATLPGFSNFSISLATVSCVMCLPCFLLNSIATLRPMETFGPFCISLCRAMQVALKLQVSNSRNKTSTAFGSCVRTCAMRCDPAVLSAVECQSCVTSAGVWLFLEREGRTEYPLCRKVLLHFSTHPVNVASALLTWR